MSSLVCFVDHQFAVIKEDIPPELYELGVCEKLGHSIRFKLVGIVIVNNRIYSILPKGSIIPERVEEQQDVTRLVVNTLMKYKRASQEGELLKSGLANKFEPLNSVQWLIQDYLQYGFVQFQKRRYQTNGLGKIHWTKTIKQMSPYVVGGQPYYLDLVTSKLDSTTQNELSYIHQFVMSQIGKRYGWVFRFKIEGFSSEPKFKNNQMKYYVKKALNETFVDREIRLFKNLLYYLEGTSDAEKHNISLFATEHFHVVWEKMCGELMGYQHELEDQDQMPAPYWSVNNKIFRTAQIPDILVRENNTRLVFDAKYYRVNRGLDKLPGWGDIVKQLYYAQSLQEQLVGGLGKVFNAFLFPAHVPEITRYYGFASVERMESNTKFGKIHSYEVDVIKIMKQYISSSHKDIFEWLIGDLKNRN